ncbi:hypothetical protein [Streptomyces malaysiensis]|uniref:hypothetical protein n=1 Tax=Streptomyces malaysiensis TaxID=92644 RepID=UPI00131E5D7D|nr:hypothetical protein [Streptomyces malaysiensis]
MTSSSSPVATAWASNAAEPLRDQVVAAITQNRIATTSQPCRMLRPDGRVS